MLLIGLIQPLFSSFAQAQKPYAICNDGALVIEYQDYSGTARGDVTFSHFHIRNKGVVDYLYSKLGDLYEDGTSPRNSVFQNSEVIFSSDSR